MGGEYLSVEQAAARLGLSRWGVYKALGRGELRQLSDAGAARLDGGEVERFRRARQAAALERLAAKGVDLVQLARDTRDYLTPHPGAPVHTVATVGPDVVAAFGPAALHAAAARGRGVCGWCAVTVAAGMLGAEAPTYSAAYAALLGQPCEKDAARVSGPVMARLRAQVHPAATGPSEARTQARAGKRAAVPAAAVRASRAAVPAGVLRSALAAAGVAERPGTLRCGHRLAEQCACPRVASRPAAVAASAGPAPERVAGHGCGCQCAQHGGM